MRRFPLFLALIFLSIAPVAAAPADSPVRGGTLVFGVGGQPNTYDCHATNTFAVLHFVAPHYSTLLRFDTQAYPKVVSGIADTWSSSADGLTWTFKLHPNVRFHDGSPLTSVDVKATLDRL